VRASGGWWWPWCRVGLFISQMGTGTRTGEGGGRPGGGELGRDREPCVCRVYAQCELRENVPCLGRTWPWAVGSVDRAGPERPGLALLCSSAHHSTTARLATAARIKSWQMKVGAGRWIDGPTDGQEYETAMDGAARSDG
jgi:hypothetical protein